MFWYIHYISRLEKAQDMKLSQAEDKIRISTFSKFYPQIFYILGDMIPPSQDSNLFHDSSLNRTPRENCYILGYKLPNEISKDVPNREQTVISMVKFSDPEGQTVTHGSLYKFTVLNSTEISHLGKTLISPNW